MPVVSTSRDTEGLSLTIVVELAAAPARVWQVWSDPRQLERWWGPPGWPATFVQHDVVVGGTSRYFMTGPEGEKAHGWWRVVAVDEPRSLEFEDGFGEDPAQPDDLPRVQGRVELEEAPGGTRMTVHSRFATAEDMEQVLGMGMEEGMVQAMGQLDELLLTRA